MEQNQTPGEKPGNPPAREFLHEMRTAENSAAHLLPKLQSMKEAKPNLALLDVGAGSGTISVTFAELIPDGHVTGIDLNPDVLPRARSNAEAAGVRNIKFLQGNVFELPFPDETFDISYCNQVLIHIGNLWDALREMLRVTKRGGIVAAREGDYETECVWPKFPELDNFHKLMAGHMSSGGGTPTAGRQLLSWALKAGAEQSQITLSYSAWSYHTPSDKKICSEGLCSQLRGGTLREKALKFGLGTESDLEEMTRAWEEWAKRDDASLAMLHGEILVQR